MRFVNCLLNDDVDDDDDDDDDDDGPEGSVLIPLLFIIYTPLSTLISSVSLNPTFIHRCHLTLLFLSPTQL